MISRFRSDKPVKERQRAVKRALKDAKRAARRAAPEQFPSAFPDADDNPIVEGIARTLSRGLP